MDQLRSLADLLDLHELDRAIDRLLEQRASLPELEGYRAAHEEAARLTNRLEAARAALREVSLEIDKASGELSIVEEKAEREENRLYAGGLSARDAEYLRREVEMLRSKISDTEERVLGLMESRETAEGDVERLTTELATATERKGVLETAIKEQWAGIDAEVAAKEARKKDIVPLVEPDLMELYDDLRATRPDQDVVGALEHSVCGACHLKLSAAEEAQARKEDPPRCIHCRAILVP